MFNQFFSSQNGSEGNSFHPFDGMPFPGKMNFPTGFQPDFKGPFPGCKDFKGDKASRMKHCEKEEEV